MTVLCRIYFQSIFLFGNLHLSVWDFFVGKQVGCACVGGKQLLTHDMENSDSDLHFCLGRFYPKQPSPDYDRLFWVYLHFSKILSQNRLKIIEKYRLEGTSGFYLVLLKIQFLRLQYFFFFMSQGLKKGGRNSFSSCSLLPLKSE